MKEEILDNAFIVKDGTHDSPKYVSSDVGFPLVTSKNLSSGKIDLTDINYISKDDYDKINKRSKVDKGDLLFAMIGTVGNPVVIDIEPNFAIKNVALFKPNKNKNSIKYLRYYLSTEKVKRQLINDKKGGTQKFVSLGYLRSLKIPLPTIQEQIRIANLLSKAEGLIDKRKQTLRLLDVLVHAKFNEMFGSLKKEKIPFSKACIINPPKSELSGIDRTMQVSFIPMASVSENGEVDLSQTRTIENVWTGFTYFRENDVAFAKITPCMENGKGAILRNLKNNIGFGTTEFHILRPKPDITNAEWIYYLTMQPSFRKNAEQNMTGSAGQKRVPSDFFTKYRVVVPPYSLQNEFAQFVSLIQPIKLKLKNSSIELENLYQSLMQRAFKGELSLKEDVEWLNATGDTDDSEQPNSEYFKKELKKLSEYREPEEIKSQRAVDRFNKIIESYHKSLPHSEAVDVIDNLLRQLDTEIKIKGDIPFVPEYLKYRIIKEQLKGLFTYEEFKDALLKAPFEEKFTLVKVQSLLVELLEKEPFIEQVFEHPENNTSEPRIMFKII